MKDSSTPSHLFRSLLAAAGLAVALVGCGGGGGGGTTPDSGTACDVKMIFQTYNCTIVGCHNNANPAANLDMVTPDWEKTLVGRAPKAGGAGTASKCVDMGQVYLNAGTNPATGLFMDKLSKAKPQCGDRMPNLPGIQLTADEIACVQTWANGLTAAH
jgi:predicted CxxxxCH...CXXCH cytochrome family protein